MNAARTEKRRQQALDAFRESLEALESEEIRRRLDENRIRSDERRAIAEDIMRRKEATGHEGVWKTGYDAGQEAHLETGAHAGQPEKAPPETSQAALSEEPRREPPVPLARKIGKFMGMAMTLGGVAFLVGWAVRR